MNKTTAITAAAALAFVAGATLISQTASAGNTRSKAMPAAATEKCAGIVKAHNNDCAANGHSCAGQATSDGNANEWVKLPAGTCNKIVGGRVI